MPPSAKTAFNPTKPVDESIILNILKRGPATLEKITYALGAKGNLEGARQTLIALRQKGVVTFSIHSGLWTLVPPAK